MGYHEVSLKLSEEQVKRLSKALAIRITKAQAVGQGAKVIVTGTQAKKIAGVQSGEHGYCLLRLGRPALKKMQVGGSFWSSVGNFAKKTVTTPSGLMGLASMLPTPAAPALRVGSMAARLSGHGQISAYHKQVDTALGNMGFRPNHITHMKGEGVFKDLWSGIKKLTSFLKPYVQDEGLRLLREHGPKLAAAALSAAQKQLTSANGGTLYHVKFTKPQMKYIQGHGLFSDIAGGSFVPESIWGRTGPMGRFIPPHKGDGIFSSALSQFGLGAKKKKATAKAPVRASAKGRGLLSDTLSSFGLGVKSKAKAKQGAGLITLGSQR